MTRFVILDLTAVPFLRVPMCYPLQPHHDVIDTELCVWLRVHHDDLPSVHREMIITVTLVNTHLIDWRRQWHPTPVLLSGKPHRWRSLVGCRPWGGEESDTTE